MSIYEESEYEDRTGAIHPVVVLKNTPDTKYPFSFGVEKAKMILEHIEEIKQFVAINDRKF
jgi:hypothetical protein